MGNSNGNGNSQQSHVQTLWYIETFTHLVNMPFSMLSDAKAASLLVDRKDIPPEPVPGMKRVMTSPEQTPLYTNFWKERPVPT